MSFKAKLSIDNKDYDILSLNYSLEQEVDNRGLPSSVIRIGKIEIQIESKGDTFFFEWVCNSFLRKDGNITFSKRDDDASMKTVYFKNAYLIHYKETFASESENPVLEQIVLSAEEIQSGSGSYKNLWI